MSEMKRIMLEFTKSSSNLRKHVTKSVTFNVSDCEKNKKRSSNKSSKSAVLKTGEEPSVRKKSSAWAKSVKKITPVARISTGTMAKSESRKVSENEEWAIKQRLEANYYIDDGVSKWHLIHPIAATGKRQSPIDIETGKVYPNPTLHPILVQYDQNCCTSVVNTGNSFKVDVNDKAATMNGGALENEFRLIQFHAHWGTTAGAKGSEHTINGKLYQAELHLVHWNTKYGLFSKAVTEPDGLAVIGIFLEIGEEDHPEFEKVCKTFEKIRFKNMRTEIQEAIDPAKLLPDDLSFWHYQGSLTTPPLDESVLWHVLRKPIYISKTQLEAMASLRTGTSKQDDFTCIINNFRPPAPLNERVVSLYTGEKVEAGKGVQKVAEKKHDEKLFKEVSDMKAMLTDLQKSIEQLQSQLTSPPR